MIMIKISKVTPTIIVVICERDFSFHIKTVFLGEKKRSMSFRANRNAVLRIESLENSSLHEDLVLDLFFDSSTDQEEEQS
jgi:hypothetical protein